MPLRWSASRRSHPEFGIVPLGPRDEPVSSDHPVSAGSVRNPPPAAVLPTVSSARLPKPPSATCSATNAPAPLQSLPPSAGSARPLQYAPSSARTHRDRRNSSAALTQTVVDVLRQSARQPGDVQSPRNPGVGSDTEVIRDGAAAGLITSVQQDILGTPFQKVSSWPLMPSSASQSTAAAVAEEIRSHSARTRQSEGNTDKPGSAVQPRRPSAPVRESHRTFSASSQSAYACRPYAGPLYEALQRDVQAMEALLARRPSGSDSPLLEPPAASPSLSASQRSSAGERRQTTASRLSGGALSATVHALRIASSVVDRLSGLLAEKQLPPEFAAHNAELTNAMSTYRQPLSLAQVQQCLGGLVDGKLPRARDAYVQHFQDVVLPSKLQCDVVEVWQQNVATLEAVDAATEARLDAMVADTTTKHAAWVSRREALLQELTELKGMTVIEDSTLEHLDRRFHVLFERHGDERVQRQEAKDRADLLEKLRRNEKVLRSEIKALSDHLENVRERKRVTVATVVEKKSAVLRDESELQQELRSLMSEKCWLLERLESVRQRHDEETTRSKTIMDDIEVLRAKVECGEAVVVGPQYTPRPRWVDRQEQIQVLRLPPPKVAAVERNSPTRNPSGADDGPVGWNVDGDGWRSERSESPSVGAPAGRQRPGSRRNSTATANSTTSRKESSATTVEHLRKLTATVNAAVAMRRRSTATFHRSMLSRLGSFGPTVLEDGGAPVSPGTRRGSSHATGKGSAADGLLEGAPSTYGFVDFMFHVRGRLTIQSDCWKVVQDRIGEIRRTAQQHMDLLSNVSALSVTSASSILPKHIVSAVPPITPRGIVLPAPQWSAHDVARRCIAVWARVLHRLNESRSRAVMSSFELSLAEEWLRLLDGSVTVSPEMSRGSSFASSADSLSEGHAQGPGTSFLRRVMPGSASSLARPSNVAALSVDAISSSISLSAASQLRGKTPTHASTPIRSTFTSYLEALTPELQLSQLVYRIRSCGEVFMEAYPYALTSFVARSAGSEPGTPALVPSSNTSTKGGSLGNATTGSSGHLTGSRATATHATSGGAGARRRSRNFSAGQGVDLLKPINGALVDPDSQQPLHRVVLLAFLSIVLQQSPIRLMEDAGSFFLSLERQCKRAASPADAPSALSTAKSTVSFPFSSLAADKTRAVSVSVVESALRTVCDQFALGNAAFSELIHCFVLAIDGPAGSLFLGEAIVESGDPLSLTTQAVTSTVSSSAAALGGGGSGASATNVGGRSHDSQFGSHGNAKHVPASTARTSVPGSGVAGALGAEPLPLGKLVFDGPPYSGWCARLVVPCLDVATGHPALPSQRGAVALRSTSRNPSLVGEPTSPEDARHASESNTTVSPVCALVGLSERYSTSLDVLLRHLQLQQHRLLMLVCKVLVEASFPSEVRRGAFVVPMRMLETRLPTILVQVDDPLFYSYATMMSYYQKYPPQGAKDEKAASWQQRIHGSRRHTATDSGTGVWRFAAPELLEVLVQNCDTHSGSDHFPRKEATTVMVSAGEDVTQADAPLPSPRVGAHDAVGSADSGNGTPKRDTSPRRSKESPVGQFGAAHTTRSSPNQRGATRDERDPSLSSAVASLEPSSCPVVLFLRSVTGSAPGAPLAADAYVWKPPLSRPPVDEDYYNVEELYALLVKVQLRQYLIR